jgi:HSP20 family protein
MAIDRRYGGGYPLRDAIDRLFEGSVISPQTLGQGGFPPADLYMTDEDVVIEMAIPGAKPNNIQVSVTGDTVSVAGEVQHQRHHQQGQQPFIEEMWRGKFQRVFTLPMQVDAGKAQANFQDGILTLTLPKSEATKPRKIQVQQNQTISGESQNRTSGSSQGQTSGSQAQSTGTSQDASNTSGNTQRETVPVSGGNQGGNNQSSSNQGSGSSS